MQFHKIIFLTTLVTLTACKTPKTYDAQKPSQLRIVDMQGKAHDVQMRTPEGNVQALAEQGNLSEERMKTIITKEKPYEDENAKNRYATNNPPSSSNYPGSYQEAVNETLQTPQSPQAAAAVTQPEITASAGKTQKDQIVEYDLTTDNNDKSTTQTKITSKVVAAQTADEIGVTVAKKHKGTFVQTGSFSVLQHAKNSSIKVKKDAGSPVAIEETIVSGKKVYRVLVGPFANKQKAAAMINKLEKAGHEAIIVRNK